MIKSRAALLVAVIAIFALTACGTTVKVNGTQVDGKVPFLSSVEQAWRDGPAGTPHVQLAAETSCWLLRDPGSGELQPRALCGPIRHLKDQGKPGVFDVLEFEPQVGQDEVTIDPETISHGETGVEPPAGLELYHPEGKKPVPADQVPLPPTPKKESGLIVADPEIKIDGGTKPKNGEIIAPGFRLIVNSVGPLATLPGERDVPHYDPADNEEFLAVALTRRNDAEFRAGDADTTAKFSVRTDDAATDLVSALGQEWVDGAVDGPTTLVLSVPKGAEPELVITVGGLEQTISVRTGDRTSTTAPVSYRDKTTFDVSKTYAPRNYAQGDYALEHRITFTEASVTAFDPDRGWAPKGQLWFRLGWADRTSKRPGNAVNLYDAAKFDPGKSFRLAGAKGEAIELISGNPAAEVISYEQSGMIFARVPDSVTAIELTYAPQGTFSATGAYALEPRSGSFSFPAATYPIKLS